MRVIKGNFIADGTEEEFDAMYDELAEHMYNMTFNSTLMNHNDVEYVIELSDVDIYYPPHVDKSDLVNVLCEKLRILQHLRKPSLVESIVINSGIKSTSRVDVHDRAIKFEVSSGGKTLQLCAMLDTSYCVCKWTFRSQMDVVAQCFKRPGASSCKLYDVWIDPWNLLTDDDSTCVNFKITSLIGYPKIMHETLLFVCTSLRGHYAIGGNVRDDYYYHRANLLDDIECFKRQNKSKTKTVKMHFTEAIGKSKYLRIVDGKLKYEDSSAVESSTSLCNRCEFKMTYEEGSNFSKILQNESWRYNDSCIVCVAMNEGFFGGKLDPYFFDAFLEKMPNKLKTTEFNEFMDIMSEARSDIHVDKSHGVDSFVVGKITFVNDICEYLLSKKSYLIKGPVLCGIYVSLTT